MPWPILSTDQFQKVIDWFDVALKLTGSLALTVKFSVWLLVLLFPHEIRDGEGGIGTGTVTFQGMVLVVPLLFVAFTVIVWFPETKLVVKLS